MTIFRDIQVLAREWKKFRGKTRLCLILPIFILILKKIPQECPVPPCISASLAPGLPVSGLPCPEAGQRQHRAQRAAAGPEAPPTSHNPCGLGGAGTSSLAAAGHTHGTRSRPSPGQPPQQQCSPSGGVSHPWSCSRTHSRNHRNFSLHSHPAILLLSALTRGKLEAASGEPGSEAMLARLLRTPQTPLGFSLIRRPSLWALLHGTRDRPGCPSELPSPIPRAVSLCLPATGHQA